MNSQGMNSQAMNWPEGLRLRAGECPDAGAMAALILALQPQFVADLQAPDLPLFLASVSEGAQRNFLAQPDRYRTLLAEDAGTGALQGFITLRDGQHLFNLFVARERQGQGLARALWQQVAQPGQRYTVNAALPAVPVYERLGFQAAGEAQTVHGVAFMPMVRPGAAAPAEPGRVAGD